MIFATIALQLAPAPATSPAAGQAAEEVQLTAVQLFDFADAARDRGDVENAERAYRALTQDRDPDVRAEARFRLGVMLAKAGRPQDAAVALRALLDEKPEAARVRVELAAILAGLGDEQAARRELRRAQAVGLPPEVALVVDQFANALRARKPFGGSFSFALVPDSNINRATNRETLDTVIAPLELSQDARETSGLGVRIGGQAYARVPVAANLALVPRLSGQAELYRQRQFNDVSASAAVGLEWNLGDRDRLQPSIAQTLRYYGREFYAQTQSASVNWTHVTSRTSQLGTALTVARADYQLNDLQDGWLFDVGTTYETALSARSSVGLTASASRQSARDPGYATAAGGVSVIYSREIGRTALFGTVGLRRLEADERLFLYSERRREWLYSASIGATFRQLTIARFAPVVRVNYERNASTVGIYDYSRVALDVGITRAF